MKHFKLFASTGFKLMLAFCIGAFFSAAAGAPEHAVAAGAAFTVIALIPTGMDLSGQLNTITITDGITEWGAVYRAGGEGVKDLLTNLKQQTVPRKNIPKQAESRIGK